jgi:hypothetical protein
VMCSMCVNEKIFVNFKLTSWSFVTAFFYYSFCVNMASLKHCLLSDFMNDCSEFPENTINYD